MNWNEMMSDAMYEYGLQRVPIGEYKYVQVRQAGIYLDGMLEMYARFLRMATGKTNDEIDEKIAEAKEGLMEVWERGYKEGER